MDLRSPSRLGEEVPEAEEVPGLDDKVETDDRVGEAAAGRLTVKTLLSYHVSTEVAGILS